MTENEIVLALLYGDMTEAEVKTKAAINQYRINEIMIANHNEGCCSCQTWTALDTLDDNGICPKCQREGG